MVDKLSNNPKVQTSSSSTVAINSNQSSLTTTMWSTKPVKMKLFGAWEIDKTPSDCIPRLCSLNITRLSWNKSLGSDINAINVAVKMQNRILRSNEIPIPTFSGGQDSPFDIELDLSFTLQYPHFIKRNRNYIQIILQRRKKYKNKAILGYKTLAHGSIDMVEVLQRSTISERNLDLIGRVKDFRDFRVKDSGKNDVIARITISSLKSQPIDQDQNLRRGKVSIDRPDVYSDDEEFTSAEDGSDSETIEEGNDFRRKLNVDRKSRKLFSTNTKFPTVDPANVQQRNLKQKFISLLKRFRLPDSEAYDSEEKFQEALEKELMSSTQEPADIDDLFDEEIDDLDSLSDSGQEFDDVSISSTPKPSLRPFFSSCTLVGQDKSYEFPVAESLTKQRLEESQETSGTDGTPETSEASLKAIPVINNNNINNVNNEQANEHHHHPPSLAAVKKKLSFDKDSPINIHQSQLHPSPAPSKQRSRLFVSKDKDLKNVHQKEKKSSLHATFSLLTNSSSSSSSAAVLPTSMNYSPPNSTKDQESKEFVLGQLHKIFPLSAEEQSTQQQQIPEEMIFINLSECANQSQSLLNIFSERNHKAIGTKTLSDIKYTFNFLCTRIQRFCNNNLKFSSPIKLVLIGSDSYANSFLRVYVDFLANKTPEWQNYLRFYLIPLCLAGQQQPNMLHKYLASIDTDYSNCFFNIFNLKDCQEISSQNNIYWDNFLQEFYTKVINFLNRAQHVIQMPIAEAMVTYKDKIFDDPESSSSNQVFIPFICDVKVGLVDLSAIEIDPDSGNISITSNTIQSQPIYEKSITSPTSTSTSQKDQSQSQQCSPPNSPSISAPGNQMFGKDFSHLNESIDLQVDYWTQMPTKLTINNEKDSNKDSTSSTMPSSSSASSSSFGKKSDTNCKFTLKNTFRKVQISRLPNKNTLPNDENISSTLTFTYMTKEKKQKIMRLGKKKEKDVENKCQSIEGICRLVCSYKGSHQPIKVIIDGVEYSGVKFFQLTPQWQTQIKFLPVVISSSNVNNNNYSTDNKDLNR